MTVDDTEVGQHNRLISAELEDDYMLALYQIELAIVEVFREKPDLTDQIVADVLNDLACRRPSTKKMHNTDAILKNRIESHMSRLSYPPRILTNAVNQVLGSVNGFLKRSSSKQAYLDFVTGYFS